MRMEQKRKKEQAEREAAEREAEAKKNGRKDAPWLQKRLIVKVIIECALTYVTTSPALCFEFLVLTWQT